MRFHLVVMAVGRGVGPLDAHRGSSDCGVGITHRRGHRPQELRRIDGVLRSFRAEYHGPLGLVVDLDQRAGISRLVERLGYDQRDRLAGIMDRRVLQGQVGLPMRTQMTPGFGCRGPRQLRYVNTASTPGRPAAAVSTTPFGRARWCCGRWRPARRPAPARRCVARTPSPSGARRRGRELVRWRSCTSSCGHGAQRDALRQLDLCRCASGRASVRTRRSRLSCGCRPVTRRQRRLGSAETPGLVRHAAQASRAERICRPSVATAAAAETSANS